MDLLTYPDLEVLLNLPNTRTNSPRDALEFESVFSGPLRVSIFSSVVLPEQETLRRRRIAGKANSTRSQTRRNAFVNALSRTSRQCPRPDRHYGSVSVLLELL